MLISLLLLHLKGVHHVEVREIIEIDMLEGDLNTYL